MKKVLILSLALFLANVTFAQRMLTRSGEIKFDASMPNLVEIAGKSNTVSAILDQATGQFATSAIIKSFRFKSPLMEEHFNENYMESSKFPKATFKGKIVNFDASKITSKKKDFDLEGDLTIHGVSKKVKTKITFVQSGEKLISTSTFKVKPIDFNIKIPSIVKSKIAETVEVNLKFELEKKV